MRIAFVYDHVNKIGGAERILTSLHELYPAAPLYTLVYDKYKASWAKTFEVIPSFVQQFPLLRSKHEIVPFMPLFAFEKFDFSNFDIVISITSADAKGIITKPQTLHICYLLTPTRYIWSHFHDYFRNLIFLYLTLPLVVYLRLWDQISSTRPDTIISISRNIAHRCEKYYHRSTQIIYPPVDMDKFKRAVTLSSGDYYLIVARLVRYKHIEIAIRACNDLKRSLKIIGDGNEKIKLKRIAGNSVEFLGVLTDDELIQYYQNCRALIFPQEEDFGLTAVEAMACGKPVIAYNRGGIKEIIKEGITGEFFSPQTSTALKNAILRSESKTFDKSVCRMFAKKFSKTKFKRDFLKYVKEEWNRFKDSKIL